MADTNTTPAAETLTDDMIRELRIACVAAGRTDMVMECDFAVGAPRQAVSRWHCAEAINRMRRELGLVAFVHVVP